MVLGPHALSRCGVRFPVSYYSWSPAWMSQEMERAAERKGKKRGWKGEVETEIDRQRGKVVERKRPRLAVLLRSSV